MTKKFDGKPTSRDIIPYEETTIYQAVKDNQIGARLRALMRKSDMTSEEVMEKSKIPKMVWEGYISNKAPKEKMTQEHAKTLAIIFDCNIKILQT